MEEFSILTFHTDFRDFFFNFRNQIVPQNISLSLSLAQNPRNKVSVQYHIDNTNEVIIETDSNQVMKL